MMSTQQKKVLSYPLRSVTNTVAIQGLLKRSQSRVMLPWWRHWHVTSTCIWKAAIEPWHCANLRFMDSEVKLLFEGISRGIQQPLTCSHQFAVFVLSLHFYPTIKDHTVYPKKYAHGFCFAVLCCGYTLTDFPISMRLTSLAPWQSNDCPSASKATLMNMDKYFMWINYERLHYHIKAKHNKTVCIFLGIYCSTSGFSLFY